MKIIYIFFTIILSLIIFEFFYYLGHRLTHESKYYSILLKSTVVNHYNHHTKYFNPKKLPSLVKSNRSLKDFIFNYYKNYIPDTIILLIIMFLIYYMLLYIKIDKIYALTLIITFIILYFLEVYMHYSIHDKNNFFKNNLYINNQIKNHKLHHRNYCNYGVITNLFDYIFNTVCNKNNLKIRNIFENCSICEEN